MSVNRANLRHLVEKGSSRAAALTRILEHPEWFLSTTLLGTNFSTTMANAVTTLFVIEWLGEGYELLALLVTVPLILVLGEMVPKALSQRSADSIAMTVVFPLRVLSWMMAPFVAVVALVARASAALARVRSTKRTPFVTREELELVFRASEQPTGIKALERRMIHRIFRFSERHMRDIMIPLAQVVSVSQDATLAEAAAEMRRSGFSRTPVYQSGVFNVVGWVNQYDLLFAADKTERVRSVMRPIQFVPANAELGKTLVRLQGGGHSMAVVVNEYGDAVGLVTLEDVIEEVVGDIEDEYDAETPLYRRVSARHVVVKARIPLQQLGEVLHAWFPPGEYQTLSGFLLSRFQRVPKKGEELRYRKLLFRIREGSERHIEEVEVFQS